MKSKILFLLALIVFLVGCATEQASNVAPTKVESAPSQVEPAPEKQVEKEVKTFKIGEEIRVDDLTYVIDKVETYTSLGTSFFGKETQGLFYKVYLSITNNARETQNIFTPRFKIIDDEGYEYDSDTEGELYVEDTIFFGEQLQPRLAVSGSKIFELPKIAKNLKLEIRGNWLSTEKVVVDLESSKIITKGKETSTQDKIDDEIEDLTKQSQAELDKLLEQLG